MKTCIHSLVFLLTKISVDNDMAYNRCKVSSYLTKNDIGHFLFIETWLSGDKNGFIGYE